MQCFRCVLNAVCTQVECTLSAGEFGVVYKGHILKDLGRTVVGVVAVKTLKGLVTVDKRARLQTT